MGARGSITGFGDVANALHVRQVFARGLTGGGVITGAWHGAEGGWQMANGTRQMANGK